MTIMLIAAVIFYTACLQWELRRRDGKFDAEREAWRQERSELLTRIQHPELVPVAPRPDLMIPDRENDDWNKVGTIEWDDAYGVVEDDVNG